MTPNSQSIRILIFSLLLCVTGTTQALLPFEHTGNLYVSMWSADEIAVFTPDGTPVERFSTTGLDGPRGIAFNPANGEIWVAGEFSNAIHIFDHNHQFLRVLEHPEFNEPVGVTFSSEDGVSTDEQLVFISNSNGNELMVFEQQGTLLRRFTTPSLQDPNCSAFMADGSLFVANRLGSTSGSVGAVSKFDTNEEFLFDFTTNGIQSLMAVARDPNTMPSDIDDTLWVTSGGGDTGIYEFDQNGNLLTSLLPGEIDDGSAIVPQGIAFDDNGDFYVVSYRNEVIKFDASGNFLFRFPTGNGTARSTAFQACQTETTSQQCIPLGADIVGTDMGATGETIDTNANSSGGGSIGLLSLASLFLVLIRHIRSTCTRLYVEFVLGCCTNLN